MEEASNYFYFFRQLKNIWIALVLGLVIYKIPFKFFYKHKIKIFIFTIIFQLLVFTPLWVVLNGSRWWIYISWLGTIQPAEFFRLGFVFFMSSWFIRKKEMLSSIKWLVGFLIVTWLLCFVFLLLPDLGPLLVLGPVALIMYWYVGGKIKYVVNLFALGIFLGGTIGMRFNYVRVRMEHFLNPDMDTQSRWVGWQINQSLISVWSGGMFGRWYGKWLQKFGYIPFAQSDFIFAAFSEEMGFVGNMFIVGLYMALMWYFLLKLKYVKNEYYRTLWVGLVSLITIQALVNIWVNINLLPLTWITLPFISFGWTSMLASVIKLVLMYKIISEWQQADNINPSQVKKLKLNKSKVYT